MIQQALVIWFLLQLLFGYAEYRYKPDIIYIFGRLLTRKYVIPSIIVPIAYIFLVLFLRYFFRE